MGSMRTLIGGLLGLIAAGGIGLGVTHLLGPIPHRWRLPSSLISGVAIIDLIVMLVLFVGGGVTAVKLAGGAATLIGCCVLVGLRRHIPIVTGLKTTRNADGWFIAVIVAVVALNLIMAVAPSTKIDELYYHMLIPKRIMEDRGVHLYRWPFEAAFFPQTAFQLGLSAAHAAGFPEAGNVVSWGLGTALILLVAGLTADLTGSTTAGWATGAISAVGLYSSVWHVTSGPHALGDLATVTAVLLALLPDRLTGEFKAQTRLFLVCLAAYAAASTKVSILPLSWVVTLIGIHRAAAQIGWRKAVGIALIVWAVFYGPIILWTTLRCGSPLGLAAASMFHSHYFGPSVIARLAFAKEISQTGWIPLLAWVAPSVSVGVVAAFGVVAFAAWKRERICKALLGLVCGQALLIAWLLPHEFRFLGGLQYVVLIIGAWVLWPCPLGARLIARWWLILIGACLPWLAIQVLYARPFIKVVSGIESRESFLYKYVAFIEDFRALNTILPPDAVIYVVNSRIASYYAPRPVIFTLGDLRGHGHLYRFTVGAEMPPGENSLTCAETVYQNNDAVSIVYRTPGRAAVHEPLKVELCDVAGVVPAP
ncbi:MAG: hypothetical protein ACLQVL_14265 [Terriglobia bacterium]